jgi:hypothetical protein
VTGEFNEPLNRRPRIHRKLKEFSHNLSKQVGLFNSLFNLDIGTQWSIKGGEWHGRYGY